jgi:hypothetical protein
MFWPFVVGVLSFFLLLGIPGVFKGILFSPVDLQLGLNSTSTTTTVALRTTITATPVQTTAASKIGSDQMFGLLWLLLPVVLILFLLDSALFMDRNKRKKQSVIPSTLPTTKSKKPEIQKKIREKKPKVPTEKELEQTFSETTKHLVKEREEDAD